MTEQEKIKKITVNPIAGVDFLIIPQGVALTIRYYAQEAGAAATNEREKTSSMQSLTVGLTAAQATEIASSLQRAAQMIQSRTDPA
jgi:hypothetical protein